MRFSSHQLFWGLLLIVLGTLLLLSNLGIISQDIWIYWPVIFILVGLKLILHAYGHTHHNPIEHE